MRIAGNEVNVREFRCWHERRFSRHEGPTGGYLRCRQVLICEQNHIWRILAMPSVWIGVTNTMEQCLSATLGDFLSEIRAKSFETCLPDIPKIHVDRQTERVQRKPRTCYQTGAGMLSLLRTQERLK